MRTLLTLTARLIGAGTFALLAGCAEAPADHEHAGEHQAALTAAQCDYFDVNGKVQICHKTTSTTKPYTILKISEQACINAHTQHPEDYIAVNDPTCQGGGCLPKNAPCDPTLPCCDGLTCQNGVCKDLCENVSCTAQDQCHEAGTCDPATGQCSNPVKADGSACSDGNACTQSDTCQAGACAGANPVSCGALDQCHEAGSCDPATGVCSNPEKADGTACNDGNACTQSDTCQAGACAGANPVSCAALDQCHEAGSCDPATGVCSNPEKADGSACNDGNACTQSDTCQAGACAGANPVSCAALDQCHEAGSCDPATGVCSNPEKADGSACNDGNACTENDSCQAGACVNGIPKVCGGGECDASTGNCPVHCPCRDLGDWHAFGEQSSCSYSAGSSASLSGDGDSVLYAQATAEGNTCGSPSGSHSNLTADELALCLQDLLAFDASEGANGQAPLQCACLAGSDGTACNDGNACTTGDTCQSGACTTGQPVVCDPGTVCNPQTGACVDPCEGNPCQNGGTCATTVDGFSCTCTEGYGGATCEDPADPCAWGPCENGGTCTPEGLFYYTCACPPSFTGPECDIPVNPCDPDPCNDHGLCIPGDLSDPNAAPFTCTCAAGWQGTNCEIPSCPCEVADPAWAMHLANPGMELIPEGFESFLSQCHVDGGTFDLSDFRVFVPGFNPSDFSALVSALDPNNPDYNYCVDMSNIFYTTLWTTGFAGAGTFSSTINGETTTGTYCMTNMATYETSADQNALCLGAVEAAGAANGGVSTWTF